MSDYNIIKPESNAIKFGRTGLPGRRDMAGLTSKGPISGGCGAPPSAG
jgi:hypothetical protein